VQAYLRRNNFAIYILLNQVKMARNNNFKQTCGVIKGTFSMQAK